MRKAAGILATLTSQSYQPRVGAREEERERESWRHYKIKQLRSPHVSSASLFMWLSGSGLRQNQTPAGHLMIERISELIGRCRGIWTKMTYSTQGCTDRQASIIPIDKRRVHDMHTPAQTYSVTLWLLEWWISLGSSCLEYCMESGAGGES